MGSMTIRQIDDDLKARLKKQATEKGVSMEAEARRILKEGVREKSAWEAIQEALGPDWEGVEFELPPRGPDNRIPDFGD